MRTLLFAPANHPRRTEKALGLAADGVILDLEDAVAVSEKAATRAIVVQAFSKVRAAKLYVRVNALDTEWSFGDLTAVVLAGLDGIILPKAEHAHDVKTADWLIANLERERGLPSGSIDLIPIIETARGITSLRRICRSGSRIRRVAFGAGDFTLDMGMTWTRSEAELLPYRSACVLESRSAGLEPPIDTVWADLRDKEGFLASCRHAADIGFQGKMCIHPDQIAGANAAFSPDDAAIAKAKRVVEAFSKAEAEGLASIQLDGMFIDYPIANRARRLLESVR